MTLSKLLENVTVTKMFQTLYGQMVVTHEVEVKHVHYDSRKIERGDLFVAIRGTGTDGNTFVQQAIANGAKVVVTDNNAATDDFYFMHHGVVKIVVPDARKTLAQLSANIYGRPSSHLTMTGITGTNGKTSTAFLIKWLLETTSKTGLIGTIEYHFGNERLPATHTTPESLELQELLKRMVSSGCKNAVMEVSSHALHQHRVHGIDYQVAVFTNLTQDHLDYHKSMEDYFSAKKILFDSLRSSATAIINLDDEWGRKLYQSVSSRKMSYGIASKADFRANNVSLSFKGTGFTIEYDNRTIAISAPLVGRFNVSNMLAAFSAGYALGIAPETMQERFRTMAPIAGRFEQIPSPFGWTAIVDYAHTHDALEKTLNAIHDVLGENKKGKIITVFGCGGNRDTKKRPKMAEVASRLSDMTIVTSDNPRFEEPEMIIDDVMTGIVPGKDVIREADRNGAITIALTMAHENDIVLIAGKGHEDYQIIRDEKKPFSDQNVVREFIRKNA
ncbi:MAG: UDP-N-acetylmuramoyl-L-alanyl-D-glutamate--2,6-diaminopimelate ligase [Bacteroidetes bacterium]|nr:MAG: UDP-N-acetylmuramoyl-L-alanyl-D-glutamate--2,6-diaminopimelate ligase [Bacteroidota bacterium]